ncbi:MAG: 50S ribosomal protein L5 [Elusimicrobiaceae bacterium]
MAKKKETQGTEQQPVPKDYQPRLKVIYREKILPVLLKDLNTTSPMAVPKLQKVVINMGLSEAKDNIQVLDQAREDLAKITGQMPQIRRAKKSISNFKLREGMPIAVRVTLRGDKMYEFVDRFIAVACPRIRDFQGFSPDCFDGRGNYNLGMREHHIFPEVDVEKSPRAWGMNITFVTSAANDGTGRMLLEHIGIPFKKK